MDGEQKRHFDFPKRDQLIQQIKELDDDIEHVSLNLIKCDFNATENDVKKTFPEFSFVKIKNYNPGSFQVVFQMKIDAINFIRNCFDRKILARRFFIKLGRQHKQVVEDWACIGYVPKKFNNKNHQKKPQGQNRDKKPYNKAQKKQSENQKGEQVQKSSTPQKKPQQIQKQPEQKQQFEKKTFAVDIPQKKHYKPQNKQGGKKNKEQKKPKKQLSPIAKQQDDTKQQEDNQDDGWIEIPKKSKKK